MNKEFEHLLYKAGIDLANLPDISQAPTRALPIVPPTLSDWQRKRLGKITGSQFHRIKRGKGGKGWSDGALTYLDELVFEWVTGMEASTFYGSPQTDWGKKYENEAIDRYEILTGLKVIRNDFYAGRMFSGLVGCTPDGVGQGILEVKCPYSAAPHMRALRTKEVPDQYTDQVNGHLLITGKETGHFVSYDPRVYKVAPSRGIVIIPVEAEQNTLEELEGRLYDFESLLIQSLENLGINWKN